MLYSVTPVCFKHVFCLRLSYVHCFKLILANVSANCAIDKYDLCKLALGMLSIIVFFL